MPKTIHLQNPVHGLVTHCAEAGDPVVLIAREFTSSEDGNDFFARVESLTRLFAAAFDSPETQPERVRAFLAIVRPSLETTVYVNELAFEARVKVKRLTDIAPGDAAYLDDIADIDTVQIRTLDHEPIDLPPDCGIALYFPHGWRHALYFDFSVLVPGCGPRTDNLPRLFGRFMTYLMFQELYSITEAQWERLFEWGWFPFAGLPHQDRKNLIDWARSDRKPEQFLEETSRRFLSDLGQRIDAWSRYELLGAHRAFFTRSKEHLEAGDWLSCISVLYPRIEGVMRTLFVQETETGSASQDTMAANLVENKAEHSALLPRKFEQDLLRVYFRPFDQRASNLPLSRHTVSHGIAEPESYDFQHAALGFLAIDQISYFLSD
jgi:hypothetical protein